MNDRDDRQWAGGALMRRYLLNRAVKAYLPWIIAALLVAAAIFVACGYAWVRDFVKTYLF